MTDFARALEMTIATTTGLDVTVTASGGGATFDRFFTGYDRAFVLPDEKEDADGFRACLALNHGTAYDAIVSTYGPFAEVCAVFDDAETGAPVGGANLIAMPVTGNDGGRMVTANLNYVYIDEVSRGGGYFGRVIQALSDMVAGLFPDCGTTPPLIFIEQNDPFAMSADNYARDTQYTGLDQLDRLRIWARRGARVVDFPYAQPPLSAGQQADDTLLYSVLGARDDRLDAAILAEHLRRFFGISVLKGKPIAAEPCAADQVAMLESLREAGGTVSLIDPSPLLASLPDVASASARLGATPSSFREALALWSSRPSSS